MKAKIKGTNQIIDVYCTEEKHDGESLYKENEWTNECFKESALDFDDTIDWEQRRFEIAKAVLPAFISINAPFTEFKPLIDEVLKLLKESEKEK